MRAERVRVGLGLDRLVDVLQRGAGEAVTIHVPARHRSRGMGLGGEVGQRQRVLAGDPLLVDPCPHLLDLALELLVLALELGRLLIGLGIGVLWFGEELTSRMLFGSAIIILAGLFLLWRGRSR